jgi:hypothetical protein
VVAASTAVGLVGAASTVVAVSAAAMVAAIGDHTELTGGSLVPNQRRAYLRVVLWYWRVPR